MKRLVVLLLIFTPWVMHSMEPEELEPKEVSAELLAKLQERRGRWITSVEEVLPGYKQRIPPASRISQLIAQEVLRKGPPIRKFILAQVSLPFTDFEGHTNLVTSAVFNPAGNKVVTGSLDNTAKIWDIATGKHLTLEGHTGPVLSVGFNPHGDNVVTGSDDTTARIWNTTTGKPLYTLTGHTRPIWSAVFNPAGDKILTGSVDKTAKIWDIAAGKHLTLTGHVGPITSAVFGPTGDKIVTSAGNDKFAKIWKTADGERLRDIEGDTTFVWSAAFNPTGDRIVTSANSDEVGRIWNPVTGELIHTLRGHTKAVTLASFNLDGDKVVTGSEDGTVKIWEVGMDEPIHTLQGKIGKFSAAGDKVVTTSEADVRIWDVKTGELLRRFKILEGEFRPAEFNSAGDKVISAFRNKARMWNLEPLLSSKEFLAEKITLQQVAILNDIFEAMKARGIVEALEEKAFKRVHLLFEDIPEEVFDFNEYPDLWQDYTSFPEAIKEIFDPYVRKPV